MANKYPIQNPYSTKLPFESGTILNDGVLLRPIVPDDFPDDVNFMDLSGMMVPLFYVAAVGPEVKTVQTGDYVIPTQAGLDIMSKDASHLLAAEKHIRIVFKEADLTKNKEK